MQKDGEAMRDYDRDLADVRRRPGDAGGAARDVAWEAARRAAAAGRVDSVQPGAVLRLQRLAGNAGVGSLVEHDEEAKSPVLDVVGKGGGSPLPDAVRVQMESRLGADFGGVRVHDDGAAAASARAVDAKAYTVGNDIVFNRGAYQPSTPEGQHTLAHELTHVLQQRSGPVDGTPTGDGIAVSDPQDRFEQEAEATATAVARTPDAATTPSAPAVPAVQRQEPTEEEEPVQTLRLQRQEPTEEEEPVQTLAVQREAAPEEEEEPVQAMSLQREEMPEEEEPVQTLALQREEDVAEGEGLAGP